MKNLRVHRITLALLLSTAWSVGFVFGATPPTRELTMLIVVGAHGNEEYRKHFTEEAAMLQEVCAKSGIATETVGLQPEDEKQTDAAKLKAAIEQAAAKPGRALWLMLIGHGTFD